MADPKPRGRVSNFLFRGLDRLVPGNNYNRATGQWSATPLQWAGAAGGLVGNMVLPGLGTAVRSGVHGYTTGDGALGFLQPNTRAGQLAAAFRGGNFTNAPLDPTTPIQYNPNLPSLNPTQRFDPNGGGQPQTQTTQGTNARAGTQQVVAPTGMAGLTGVAAQMGGARGAYNGGGYTGDAARALAQALRASQHSIDTGNKGQLLN